VAPYAISNPAIFNRSDSPPPGWFFNVEFDIVAAHVKNRLQAPVAVDSAGDVSVVHLPGAELVGTLSPRFELGYRFAEGAGEFMLAYRFLTTDGRETLVGYDLDGSDAPLRSRLDMNVIDIDYATRYFSPLPHWQLQGRVGARIATVFFDSVADGFYISDRTSNNFVGGGVHVGLDTWYQLGASNWSIFGKVDGAIVVGSVEQHFDEVFVTSDGSLTGGAADISRTQAVPVLEFQLGFSWSPWWHGHWSRYSVGYTFEEWWAVGGSHTDLTSQGLLLRAEYTF
jgi:hypothetical protein